MNNITILGRITHELEIKQINNNLNVLNFSIAVKRINKDETDFFDCTAFGKTAEIIKTYFKKGERIGIVGQLRTNVYKNDEDKTIKKTFVLINNITFIEKKNAEEKTNNTNYDEIYKTLDFPDKNINNIVNDADFPF